MIVLRAVRVDADTGTETELGEVRMLEAGAGVFSYLETAEGAGVMRDVRRRLGSDALISSAEAKPRPECKCTGRVRYVGRPSRMVLNPDCPRHGVRSLL
jgi:hypothetical protein